jgi:hypothetical protein
VDRHHRVLFQLGLYVLAPLLLAAGLVTGTPGAAFAAGIAGTTAALALAATGIPDQNRQPDQAADDHPRPL